MAARSARALLVLAPVLALSAAAEPTVQGLYSGGDLGILQLTTEEGRLSGKFVGGGSCPFVPDQLIVQGQFEGDVLVGKVLLCQTGPGCRQKHYWVLAFYDAVDQSLAAHVKLDAGCASPALNGNRLSLRVVSEQERASAKDGSAALIAKKKVAPKKRLELHRAAVLEAKRLFNESKYDQAAEKFEEAISYEDHNWAAHYSLGVAEFMRGNVRKAIDSYERAALLASQDKVDTRNRADIYYNLGCAHSRLGDRKAALKHLQTALSLGFSDAEHMSTDQDLKTLFGNDPEFQKLVQRAQAAKSKNGRKGESRL